MSTKPPRALLDALTTRRTDQKYRRRRPYVPPPMSFAEFVVHLAAAAYVAVLCWASLAAP